MIAYLASADIVRGTIEAEEVTRIPLQQVMNVTSEAVSRRTSRAENERLFLEYERVIKNDPSREMISVEQCVRITKMDGEDLLLPAGSPVYWRGKHQNADERFARVAGEISRKAREARANGQGELRP